MEIFGDNKPGAGARPDTVPLVGQGNHYNGGCYSEHVTLGRLGVRSRV
jgi:hypothetical protein